MRNFKFNEQLQIEPGYYYHIGMPFDLKHVDAEIFNEGYHFGQFASYIEIEKGLYRAVRDPLGIGKLFYTETSDGKIHFSDKYVSLFPFKSAIYSVPAGTMVNIGSGGRRELVRRLDVIPKINERLNQKAIETENIEFTKFRQRIDNRLNALFARLKNYEDAGWTLCVALSGGLDSTIIASKAAEYLKNPVAFTLDLGKSEDCEKSQKIAKYLGISHIIFSTDEEKIINALNRAPALCQDYRDFNVHCAALNILLAKNIKHYVQSNNSLNEDKIIVLTGDLMNEFTGDYEGEIIDGIEYYRLPMVGKKELQNVLIRGLDTSDREISIFKEYGLKCIQPFAALYDLYYSVDESVLTTNDPKKLMNSFLIDSDTLDFIPKVKLRAQVGSRENMGILGICHKKGINNKIFRNNLLEGLSSNSGLIPIFAGRYEIEDFK